MIKNYKILRNSLGIICILFVALIIVLAEKSDLYQIDSPYRSAILVPKDSWEILDFSPYTDDGKFAFQRVFKREEFGNLTTHPSIIFGSVNVRIKVFFNDKQIYSFGNNGKNYVGLTSGDSVHMIRLPEEHIDEFTLRIEYSSFEKKQAVPKVLPNLFIGTMADLLHNYTENVAPEGIMSLGILIIGIMGILFSIAFLFAIKKIPSEYMTWSIFATLCGIMFLFDSHLIDLFIGNSFILYFVPTIILATIPIIFHIHVITNKTLAYNRQVMTFFSIAACAMILLDCFSAVSPLFSFAIAKIVTNVFIICYLFFLIAIQVTEHFSYSDKISVPKILFLLSNFSLIVDLGMNIIPPENEMIFFFSRPIFLVHFIVQTVCVLNDFFNVQILSTRKEAYESVVNQDILTGVHSRQSFWNYRNAWEKKNSLTKTQTMLILSEVSNLPAINEKFGFAKGDDSIKILATLLQQNFSSSNVYRFDLGGFAVLTDGMTKDILERKIHDTREYIEEYNKGSSFPIEIHFAYDFFDNKKDEAFDSFVTRIQLQLFESKLH